MSNVPWYRSGAIPGSHAYVDEIRAPKRQKASEGDDEKSDMTTRDRETDFSKPFVVSGLANGTAKYLVPTIDGYAVDNDTARQGRRFRKEWLTGPPLPSARPDEIDDYNEYMASAERISENRDIAKEPFNTDVFDLLDARLDYLLQHPAYQFLVSVQGHLQARSDELLLRSDYAPLIKKLFSNVMVDLMKELKNNLPLVAQSEKLISSNSSALDRSLAEMGEAVSLVMPPFKPFSDLQFVNAIAEAHDGLRTTFPDVQSAQQDYKFKAVQARLDRQLGASDIEAIKTTIISDVVGISVRTEEYKRWIDEVWTTVVTETKTVKFEANQALQNIKEYTEILDRVYSNNANTRTYTVQVSPYFESLIDRDDGQIVPFNTVETADILVAKQKCDELARNPLASIVYQFTGASPSEAMRRKAALATGILRFIEGKVAYETDLKDLRDYLSNFAIDLEKGAPLAEIFKKCGRILHQLARLVNQQYGVWQSLGKFDEGDVLGTSLAARDFESDNLQFIKRNARRVQNAAAKYATAATFYELVSKRLLHIYVDLRLAVIANIAMYEAVHEIVALIMEPVQNTAVRQLEVDRSELDESRRQLFLLPRIKEYISSRDAKNRVLAEIAKRGSPVMTGQFIFAPVLQAAIETAESHLKLDFASFHPDWIHFEARPTIEQADTGFKTVFAEFVTKFILIDRREAGGGVIETLVSKKTSIVQLRSIIERIRKFQPQPAHLAGKQPPQLYIRSF